MKTSIQLLLYQSLANLSGILFTVWLMSILDVELSILVLAISATILSTGLGFFLTRRCQRRFTRLFDIIQAWNRGSLSLRIGDRSKDQIGLLGIQLDQLAEHLEEDERDLDELRQRNMRLTDQVRALTVVEERNRLARELHDNVKQHLFSLTMTASGMRAHLEEVADDPPDPKRACVECHMINIHDLYPKEKPHAM